MFHRFRVTGESMLPIFSDGDYVLTRPGKPKKGDVVVLRHEGLIKIKRIETVEGNEYFVSGDNKSVSKLIGPLERKAILGKVWLHSRGGSC